MNIQAHDSVFLSDMEKYQFDSVRRMANLLREFDKAGIETALFEEYRSTPASRQAEPMSREYLKNMRQRDRTITRQVLEEIERETAGYISPEARAGIIQEVSHMQNGDEEDSAGT